VHKVSIIPRGRALGVTMFLPEEDRYSYSKQRTSSARSQPVRRPDRRGDDLGPGRVTTGASNDIQRATEIARNMVTKWGLSEKLGPLTYDEDEQEVFLGRSVTQHTRPSRTRRRKQIDKEVRNASSTSATRRPRPSSRSNVDKLHAMADALMQVRDHRCRPDRRHHGRQDAA
jgi:cell division protease FtsH